MSTDPNYEVEIIKVSKNILAHYFPQGHEFNNTFERISQFMDKGNELRKSNHDFIAMQVVKEIFERRKKWSEDNKDKNSNDRRVAYLIDSLKHEDEIKSLRQIYTNGFFQLSLYESKTARINSLVHEHGISEDKATQLIERDEGEKNSYGQHTREAFHLADYFLKFDSNHNELKEACYRFLSIVFQDPYITPTFNEFATYMSFTASVRSADLSRQVGAVVAKDKNILAIGSNDVPKFKGGTYWPFFNEANGKVEDFENGRDFKVGEDANAKEKQKIIDEVLENIATVIEKSVDSERVKALKDEIEVVLKNSKIKEITEYGRVVHAEMDALLSCSRSNISTLGATLFVTTFPCHNCAKHILSAGIEKVIFVEPYPKSKALEMHKEAITQKWESIEPETKNKLVFEPFVGVGARNFVNLFSMSLGVGSKLKRKDSTGKIIEWCSEKANLRMPLQTLSYKDLELKVVENLSLY